MLNKNDLLSIVAKREVVSLEIGDVIIREFLTSDREQFEKMALNASGDGLSIMKSKMVAVSLINEDGHRLFGDDEIASISSMPSGVVETIFEAIVELNGMGESSLDKEVGN